MKNVRERLKIVGRIAGSDKIFIAMRVDPSLIGGLVVRIDPQLTLQSKVNLTGWKQL